MLVQFPSVTIKWIFVPFVYDFLVLHVYILAQFCVSESVSTAFPCVTLIHRQTDRRKKLEFMYTYSLNAYDFIQLDVLPLLCNTRGSIAFNLEYISKFFINFKNQWQFWNPHDKQMTNLSLIFEFHEELIEMIDNEKDDLKLFFEKYQLSLTSSISSKTSSNWAFRECFGNLMMSRFHNCHWVLNLMKIYWRKSIKTGVAK